MIRRQLVVVVTAATISFLLLARPGLAQDGEVRLLVRGDDMGVAQSVNEACICSAREGVVRSVVGVVAVSSLLESSPQPAEMRRWLARTTRS